MAATQNTQRTGSGQTARKVGNTMGNVVADVTAHVQRLHKAGNTAPQTPAQYAAAVGYPGSKASALRKHIARQHGQGAQATGHGRYPAVTPAQMLGLLGAGVVASKPDATAQARKQASSKVAATLWPKQRAAARKGSRKAKATAQATPAPQASEPTAQASASDTTVQA